MRTLPIIVLAVVLAASPAAQAGTYEHHTLTAASPGLDGWSPAVSAPGGRVAAVVEPGALAIHFWERPWFMWGERGDWIYTAPDDTSVARWEFERSVSGVGGGDWNTLFGAVGDGRWRELAHDAPSRNRPWGRLAAGGLAASALIARLQCGGPHACPLGSGPALRLRSSRVVLHDGHAPRVSAVRGDLAGDRPLAGTAALSFAATDRGGGVHRAWVEVDGVRATTVAVGDERCRELIAGGPREFAFRVPCPLAAGATVPLDTTRLADGRHVIAVHVEDAAGHGPAATTVANRAAPPPVTRRPPATPTAPHRTRVTAWLERGHHRTRALTVRHGARVRIRGRITDTTGRPLAGAGLAMSEQTVDGYGHPLAAGSVTGRGSVAADRGSWRPVTGIRSRDDGRFTAFARIGPSRRLRIAAVGGSRAPLLTLRVRAPLGVRASRRGGALLVRGRLRGGHVPRGGALVELQTRAGRGWATRLVLRTWRSGRFAGRLAAPAGRVVVRVRVPRQPGLPYAAGWAVTPPRTAGRTAPRTSRR
jgi:hypothetical protein